MSDVREFFEGYASTFDSYYSGGKLAPLARLAHRVFREPGLVRRFGTTIELLGQVEGKRVLDVGCGPGFYAVYLAKQGAEVTGIDFSAAMVDLACDNASSQGVEAVFINEDFLEWEPDALFDYSIAIGLFDYTAKEQQGPCLERLRDFTREKIVATFPKLFTFQSPIRKAWFSFKPCGVHFYTQARIQALAGEACLKPELVNCGPIWTVAFTK